MSSFFRYPGGKSKLRKTIVNKLISQSSELGSQYREPFFGGGSIGLSFLEENSFVKEAWINDKDIGISCLWMSVMNYPEELKKMVLGYKPTVESFYKMKSMLTSLENVPLSYQEIVFTGLCKLAIHQISYSGLGTKSGGPLGGLEQKSQYDIGCRWSPEYICRKIDKIHNMGKRICFKCTNSDFSDVILDDSCKALIYLDPPYFVKGNDLYQHGFSYEDHLRLSEYLKSTSHSWVLSYDDCPEIRSLYEWADIEVVDVMYSITATKDSGTGERKSRTKPELLISNINPHGK